ncbi:MAG: hypothetical protein AW09_000413 [Candidatus Accumulibacter phosphatis]|uniref:Uncharacterized protein n=1 Tax=Candidatus Accumulibacter phosphatis TaxID=327160 RepID=A0A080LZB1_9PROT|nr:MAG: hypothetical protein AW09_000413 [Candidatus Accumulibacter phosphatis]
MIQVLGEQHQIGLRARQLRTAPHGHRDLRLRQYRSIIDAVANHRHHRPAGLQAAHIVVLGLR